MNEKLKNKKVIFCDLDGTLIDTISGEPFPKGIWDMKLRLDVFDSIKKLNPEYILIVSNQDDIESGSADALKFETKLSYIIRAIGEYCDCECYAMYCDTDNKSDSYYKPNTKMLEMLLEDFVGYDFDSFKHEMLMIGDASGKEGQFSDSDKKTAENFGIDYMDVNDFVECFVINKIYKYHPKIREELRNLIKQRIKDEGTEVDLNDIDVSKIIDMSSLFEGTNFNGDISKWNVSNVTDMRDMFSGCKNFNGDISNWDVSNVTDMSGVFCGCKSFNQDISKWDVSNVIDMSYMFNRCKNFNQDISKWNVSKVRNMRGIFYGCENFNQDISDWDVSNVTDMWCMFNGCKEFNQDISGWNVSKVKYMIYMFYDCENFNQDISGWDVSRVTDMCGIFQDCPIKDEYKPKFKK